MQKEILLLFRPSLWVSDTLAELLEANGYIVHQSDKPIDLLRQVISFECLPYSLIILEILMPGMDGVELFKRMMKYKVRIPIILMSAHLNEEIGIEFEEKGLFKYMSFPPDNNEFLDVVKQAVSLDHLGV